MTKRIDLLNRGVFIDDVLKVVNQLSDIKKGCCFAIEGSWGIGKTFVIEEIEKQLKKSDRYFVFHYNCWQYDYYEEPSVAIVSAMLHSMNEQEAVFGEKVDRRIEAGWMLAKEKLREIVGLYIENKIGIDLISLFDNVEKISIENQNEQYDFDKLFNFTRTIEAVREKLQEIAKERTIVVVVDELDRCIPQYAVRILERLHHIFYGMQNVVVIMAIAREQLEHSVEEMFGMKENEKSIDVNKYLKKFIDFSLKLDIGELGDNVMEKYEYYFNKFSFEQEGEIQELKDMLTILLEDIDIRRQEKMIEKVNLVHSIVCDEIVDSSVSSFEILYEVLKMMEVLAFEKIIRLNDQTFVSIEERLGAKRINLIKQLEDVSVFEEKLVIDNGRERREKNICFNMSGRILWYFAQVFNKVNIPYRPYQGIDEKTEQGLGVAKKYVEFCGIIE